MCSICSLMRPLRPDEVADGRQVVFVEHKLDGIHVRLGVITSFETWENFVYIVRVKFEDDGRTKRTRTTTTFFGLEWVLPDRLGVLESMVKGQEHAGIYTG